MKITILSGSPKGELSITLQYVKLIQKKFAQHDYTVHHVSQRIKRLERDPDAFEKIMASVEAADGILWIAPVYVCLIPSQYKRFIELISERGYGRIFKGKYTAVMTTSVHFYDHTAHNYLQAVCDDLEMKYVDNFSPDMDEIFEENGPKDLIYFAENFFAHIEDTSPTTRHYQPISFRDFTYTPGTVQHKVDAGSKKIVVLTDCIDERTNIGGMIRRFTDSFASTVELINLNDIQIKGGCLGCCKCGQNYECAYGDKDEFMEFYKSKIMPADIIVYAGTIVDRYLSAKWKQFYDRRFFKTHTPTQTGKQIAFLISGPLSQVQNLRQILIALTDLERANLVDLVADEFGDSTQIDALLHNLAQRLVKAHNLGYVKPITFLGVGGKKVFRDEIWGRLRFAFQADHRYYEQQGFYDFPQDDPQILAQHKQMEELFKDPEALKQAMEMSNKEMMVPYQKVIDNLPDKEST
ncbi:MAG: NAD(P)H-dependent oxidoreductase [Deltaproteobacteria bacterium]|nr:NAD(P)H-dependent oxidoreductase [Deltaproteobacteria bacterium]